jgi:spermidine synthase
MKRDAGGALPVATVSESGGVRFLHLDSVWVQGAMRNAQPDRIELEYVQRMCVWMLWRPDRERTHGRVVQLGLGAATLTRFCHRVLRMKTIAVELNASVLAVARLWFRLPPEDARLAVVLDDAERWVAEPANAGVAQVLNVDLYDHDAASPVLDDEAFYAGCRDVLADGGVMTVNLFGRDSRFAESLERIAGVFRPDQVWWLAPTREGNTIVVAARGVEVPDRAELGRRAATIEARYRLPALKWLRLVRPYRSPPARKRR